MKCPQCGCWNRQSFPRCFRCGADLPAEKSGYNEQSLKSEESAVHKKSIIYHVDDDGNLLPDLDKRDQLASEMQSLHDRKTKGSLQQRRLREEGSQRGFSSPKAAVKSFTRRRVIIHATNEEKNNTQTDIEGEIRPDAIPVIPQTANEPKYYEDYAYTSGYDRYNSVAESINYKSMTIRQMKQSRMFGLRRFTPAAAFIVLIATILFCAYQFILKPLVLDKGSLSLQDQVKITASIINDMAAHTIQIPAQEGSQIYIKELKKSYIVTGGYAVIGVADYTWYEQNKSVTAETMDVTLTPYIKTSAGEQKLMEIIHYSIEIPLSPLTLITPDVTYIEVSTAIYNIKFHVEQNSTVTINGEDYSTFVNTQDGYITYNALVQPIGDNIINITVQCQYYRENSVQIILYRAPQEIPLDLSSTLGDSSSKKTLTISATTLPGAKVMILSDFMNLDTTRLASSGAFSFDAVFNMIGINTIIIQADYPNKASTIVKYDVYYLPPASEYSRKAWAMDDYNYTELLNNISRRVANTQIYVCIGEITEILSSKPQLAIMDTDDSEKTRKVMLENLSSDTWEVGGRYRVYADAYGLYDAMPRLVARYTYKPLN